MKLSSIIVASFFLLAATVLQLEGSPLARGNPKGHWILKQPLQAIAKRVVHKTVSPAQTSKVNVKYVNLSEELRGKQRQKIYPSALTPKPHSVVQENEKHYKKKKNSNVITRNVIGIWGPGVNLEKEKNPKFSLMKFVLKSLKNSRTEPLKRTKIPMSSPQPPPPPPHPLPPAVPVEPEKDSYLKALEESRIPCQNLEDPTDCDDFTHLFKPYWSYNYDTSTLLPNQGLLPSSALYKEYSSVKDITDTSQFKLASQPSTDSKDFLLQKPILFLSPNIKFTIYHHSSPTFETIHDETALPSIKTIIETESSLSADYPSNESETSSLDSLVESSGLSVVGPITSLKVVPTST